MARGSGFSAQALAVLAVLADQPGRWQHGYAIAQDTGLKSGSLYPILIRLAERGLLEACWEQEQPGGGPGGTCTGLLPMGSARPRQRSGRTGTGRRLSGFPVGTAAACPGGR